MTKEEYLSAVQRCTHIPNGDNWNDRFLAALTENKLKLGWKRDNDYSIMAPWPTSEEPFKWARMSYIVEAE